MNPIARASIIAPLTVVPMSVLLVGTEQITSPFGMHLKSFLDGVLPLSAGGLIYAYAAMLLIGLPSYLAVKRLGQPGYLLSLLAATLASALAASPTLSHGSAYPWAFGFFMIFAVPIALCFMAIIRGSPGVAFTK